MPTYDYECENCAHRFAQFQKMSDAKLTDCPECHKPTLKRLIGPGMGIIYKGTGFYSTDYREKPKKEQSAQKEKPSQAGSSIEKAETQTKKQSDGATGSSE